MNIEQLKRCNGHVMAFTADWNPLGDVFYRFCHFKDITLTSFIVSSLE